MTRSMTQYLTDHKRAFRVAFDYLNAHFPPSMDDEYWTHAAEDIGEASKSTDNDPLTMELLVGVYNYLEKEYTLRRGQDEQTSDRNN